MNQAELVNEIAAHVANTGTSKVAIKFVLDAQAEVAQAALKKGGDTPVQLDVNVGFVANVSGDSQVSVVQP